MCGIVGFIGQDAIVYDLLMGLSALQHRGQDAAGAITFEGMFHTKKGLGLVSEVFEQKHLQRLRGKVGIGHVRYTTHGTNVIENAQPISTNYPFGIAMAHNGNVTNFTELSRRLYEEYHVLPTTTNDLELILYTLTAELRKHDLAHIGTKEIFSAVGETQKKVEGAYAAVAIIANHGLLAFCDPHGIRPLIIGKKTQDDKTTFALASETVCFDLLGYEVVRDMQAGEAIFIDNEGNLHSSQPQEKEKTAFCVFEYIYFAREDSTIHGRLVAGQRVKMGRRLAEKMRAQNLQPDIIIDVPNSGYFAASGLSEAMGIPHKRGLVKNNYIGRSFIAPTQAEREAVVRRKLNPIRKTIAGRKIAVVDDSIVRGTTSRRIVQSLREAGATEVYFVSAAPPILNPCIYGIDMSETTQLIASSRTQEEIRQYIGADALIYQTVEDLKEIFDEFLPTCMACLTGKYPTKGAAQTIAAIEQMRAEQP
jgi:amidophosphoribosyltransferase